MNDYFSFIIFKCEYDKIILITSNCFVIGELFGGNNQRTI